ncbi:MAG: DUF6261 family protein, partial [Bacteroidales bacterium]|nr:DUF6261 family protein [Bacteroidales bacterium]
MKITKIIFSYLRNEAQYQFLLLVQKLFDRYPSVATIVANLLPQFYELLTIEGQLVDAVRASEYTNKLAEADRRVDRDIVGINAAIKSALHHFDPEVVKAAQSLERRMKSFNGDIEKKSYEEEPAAVKILIADFGSTYAEQVNIVGINAWVRELDDAQNEFEQLFVNRNTEYANRPQQRLREVRKQIEAIYRLIVEQIDAYELLNNNPTVEAFVAELNKEVLYFNEHTHKHAKTDIAHAVVASIPDMFYGGEPVIVLPDVMSEGKKLVFTVDYELSYKNNNAIGTATLIIHGKGAFKGQK